MAILVVTAPSGRSETRKANDPCWMSSLHDPLLTAEAVPFWSASASRWPVSLAHLMLSSRMRESETAVVQQSWRVCACVVQSGSLKASAGGKEAEEGQELTRVKVSLAFLVTAVCAGVPKTECAVSGHGPVKILSSPQVTIGAESRQ